MTTPGQMFDHTLEAIKGWWSMTALDKSAPLSANVTIDPVYAGRVVHLNASKEFEMGVSGKQMAIFLLQNSNDPDVTVNPVNNTVGVIPGQAQKIMSGLVASGGYELETTEYNKNVDYAPNDFLTAGTSNTVAATGGVLTNENGSGTALTIPWQSGGSPTTRAICGVVSDGEYTNANGIEALRFWSVWLPGAT